MAFFDLKIRIEMITEIQNLQQNMSSCKTARKMGLGNFLGPNIASGETTHVISRLFSVLEVLKAGGWSAKNTDTQRYSRIQ